MNTPLSAPRVADRLQAIAQARRALLHDGVAEGPAALAPWIAGSWKRCLGQGKRPGDRVDFDLVTRAALRCSADAHRALREAAQPVLADLDRAVAPTRYFGLLTDAHGVVVAVGASADTSVPEVHAIARLGVDLSENSVGTTAIGSALGELHPVWLHRGEHFFDSTAVYSCAGAPIVGPDAQLAGMLDLTGVRVDERPELRHLAAQMAQRIELALLMAVPRAHLLSVQWPGAAAPDGVGLLAIDRDGLIAGANRAARQMLALQWQGHARRFGPLDGCFATPPGRLLGLRADAPAEAVPLWSGLEAWVAGAGAGELVNAPPRWRRTEEQLVREAIDAAQGNVGRAAQQLGVSRATMYRRLARLRQR